MDKFDINTVHSSNKYGDYIVLQKLPKRIYKIKFLLTGYTKEFSYSTLYRGNVRDPYYPIYFGVGYIGECDYKNNMHAFQTWRGIISRCYNKNDDNYKTYGSSGVTVSERWKCFQYFLEDLPHVSGYDEKKFLDKEIVLDKDMRGMTLQSNKEYSLGTCRFVKQQDNFQEGLARRKQHTSSRYVGVTKLKDGKWQASISYHSKNIYIGRYNTEKEAHVAYEKKKTELLSLPDRDY